MKKSLPFLFMLTAMLASCNQPPVPSTPSGTVSSRPTSPSNLIVTSPDGVKYLRNQVVVQTKTPAEAEAVARQLGGKVVDHITELGAFLIDLPATAKVDSNLIAQQLLAGGRVVAASPHRLLPSLSADPFEQGRTPNLNLGPQAIVNQIFDELPQYSLDANHMNAKAAWDAGLTGKGVLIGVIDDPVDVTHPDLRANWAGLAYVPGTDTEYTDAQAWANAVDGFDGKVDGRVNSNIEHGTAVASTMVAARNGRGIVGVAPEAKYTTATIFQPGYVGGFNVTKAIVWSVNQGVKVLNNSWGGTGYDFLVKDAFDYALRNNVTVVVSAGNTAHDEWRQPAMYAGVIASAASGINGKLSNFSTFGQNVSVLAPGEDILMASPLWLKPDGSRRAGATASNGSGYLLMSGTSFSGPLTSGAAALILGKYPDLDPYQVRRLLEETADGSVGSNPNGFDRETGYGAVRLDKLAARLTSSAALPPRGGVARVQVQVQTASGPVPALFGDVILESTSAAPGAPLYFSQTNSQGEASFFAVAPGTYTMRVGAPNLSLTGGLANFRGTAVGTLTVTSGSTYSTTEVRQVILTRGAVNLNPEDPYEPNDTLATATPIKYGEQTKMAYIFGKPRDQDFYSFQGQAGDKITARVFARGTPQIGGTLDSFMVLRDSNGKHLAESDDIVNGVVQDSQIDFTLPASGTYYLQVSSCTILCDSNGDDPATGEPDNSPFNKYILSLKKN